MPPKGKKKTKSKRYSCEICEGIDNSFMVQCDDCMSRYHMKCLNIKSIHEDDEWVNCQDGKSLTNKQSANKSVQLPVKKKKNNVPKPKEVPIEAELQEDVQVNQNQGQSSHRSTRNSQTTRSSVRRKTQIELDRIEEERQLKEKRDKEYLDSKYQILLEDCSERAERNSSERRSTDRSSFTKEWVRNQNVEFKIPNEFGHQLAPQTVKKVDARMPWESEKEFKIRELANLQYSERQEQRNAERLEDIAIINEFAQKIDELKLFRADQNSVPAPKSNPSVVASQINSDRIPCQRHDAKTSIDRGMFVQEDNLKIPCSSRVAAKTQKLQGVIPSNPNQDGYPIIPRSNSTFAMPATVAENSSRIQNRNQHSVMSPNSRNYDTLVWDNYMGADLEKSQGFRLGQAPIKSGVMGSSRLKALNQNMDSTKSNVPIPDDENYDDDNTYLVNDQFTSTHRSSNQQNLRKVGFEELKTNNPNRSNVLSVNSQAGTSYAPANQSSGNISKEQIASRHVVEKRLPIFVGDPFEWPIWFNQYQNSTKLCGFSNGENLDRLEKCIKGKAREKVKGRLTHPDSVPWIIDTLKMLYGRPEVIIKAIISKARDCPPLKPERLEDLMDFAFEVQTICTTIESLDCNKHLNDPMLIEELVDKLPIQEKKDWAKYKAGNPNVTLKTLAVWLYELARLLSTVATPRITKSNDRKPEKENLDKNEKASGLEHVNVHIEQANQEARGSQQIDKNSSKIFACPICNQENHKIESCSKFKSFNVDARYEAANEHKLCHKCLRKHRGYCRATTKCETTGCQYKHHSLLHNAERHSSKNNSTANTTSAPINFHADIQVSTMLRIVPVILYNGLKSVATFAFLDDGTTITMMEKRLANELGLNGTSEQLCLIWTKKIHRQERAERVSLEISGIGSFNKRFNLKGVRTVDGLHLPAQTINKHELVAKYPYLKDVPLVEYKNGIPGIMIGSDMPKFGTQLQVVESDDVENNEFNGPMASRTRLGWSVHGPRNTFTTYEHVNVHQFEICPHHNELDNAIHQRVKEYFSVENFGIQANNKFNLESKDNERALEMLNRLTKKVNGKYETGFLWKSDNVILPDSYPMALKRLVSLERQGPKIVKTIGEKIADYVSKGYARKLSQKELEYDGQVWYLPLFGVVHPKKPEKLRMVFDGAAKVKNVSLNSSLLTGPDLYTSLIDILRRFRERLYTGGGDIAEMFHQVHVIKRDRRFQRFLFRADSSKKPDIYEMDVMTFGATCSPCSAQFVKNKNANKFIKTHPRAVSAIIDNHYVDDMMECEHSEKDMVKLLQDVKMIHAEGGFNIRNFISNSENILKAVGDNSTNETKNITLKTELKVERVLGMWYNTKSDIFTFSLKYTSFDEKIFNGSKLPTKREILRTLMSIFDPLGLLTNFLIYLKILLQEVWRTQMGWDEQLSLKGLVERWKRWLAVLPEVENVKFPRLYSPKMSPNEPKSIQMHVFVDASEDAFAALVYLRIEDDSGVDVVLAGSKARVAPLKYLSIPRKELLGSVMATRLSTSITKAQRFKIDRRFIWTDSATVISWLTSDHRKYSQFVAHRVGEILEDSDVHEWRWIPTNENVADEATKLKKTPNFEPSNRWFRGPEFLRQGEEQWPEKKPIDPDVEEEMKSHYAHSSLLLPAIIDPKRFTKYKRMVRALAYAIRFINLFNGKAKKGEPLKQEELRKAENLIFRQAQFEGYPSEMVTLMRNKILPVDQQEFIEKPSPLYDGTPYLDADGILRMKGRIDGARELSMDTKRPIVLPKESHITKLLLLEYHSRFFHQNHETVVNEVRQKFYIPSLRSTLRKTRKYCQWCKVKQAHPIPPQMADFPTARLASRFVPYSFVGVDFFAQCTLKLEEGRKRDGASCLPVSQ